MPTNSAFYTITRFLLLPRGKCASAPLSRNIIIGDRIQPSKELIIHHTELCSPTLIPQIKLRLITPNCKLWTAKSTENPFHDPYWAFCWPGGQALTKYIFDNGHVVDGQSVLDVGCGCGSASIASALRGAKTITANDVDPVAIEAAQMNAELNGVQLHWSTHDLIGHTTNDADFDVVLIGDMFYDPEMAESITRWLKTLRPKLVLIGDPGRQPTSTFTNSAKLLAKYDLPAECAAQNNGYTTGYVWSFF